MAKILQLVKTQKAPRTREDACVRWILNGQQYHGYTAFSRLSLALQISTSTWTGRHQFPCYVTTISWTCPACGLWGGQNPVGFVRPVNSKKLWSGTKTLLVPPRSSAWRAADKSTCKMAHFHCSRFGPLSDRAMALTGPNLNMKFPRTAILQYNCALQNMFLLPEWYRFMLLPWCNSEVLLDEVTHDCEGNQGNEKHWCDVWDDSKRRYTQQSGATQALQGSWNVLYR